MCGPDSIMIPCTGTHRVRNVETRGEGVGEPDLMRILCIRSTYHCTLTNTSSNRSKSTRTPSLRLNTRLLVSSSRFVRVAWESVPGMMSMGRPRRQQVCCGNDDGSIITPRKMKTNIIPRKTKTKTTPHVNVGSEPSARESSRMSKSKIYLGARIEGGALRIRGIFPFLPHTSQFC